MSSNKNPAPDALLQSEDAFAWNVAVPFDPTCYGAKTIQSMVKLVNRRGQVRWFAVFETGASWRWRLHNEPIKGVDFLEDFLSDLLDDKPYDERDFIANLVVSFDEKSEARAFSRDLGLLRGSGNRTNRNRPLSPIEQAQKADKEAAAETKRSEKWYAALPDDVRNYYDDMFRKAIAQMRADTEREEKRRAARQW